MDQKDKKKRMHTWVKEGPLRVEKKRKKLLVLSGGGEAAKRDKILGTFKF